MEREDTNLEFDDDNVSYDPSLKARDYDATGVDTDLEYDGEPVAPDRPAADLEFEACIDEAAVDSTDIDLTLAESESESGRPDAQGAVDFDFGSSAVAAPSVANTPVADNAAKSIEVVESPRESILARYRLSPDCVISLWVEGSADREALETLLQRLRADLEQGVFDPD